MRWYRVDLPFSLCVCLVPGWCCTELTEVSGTCIDVVPIPVPTPVHWSIPVSEGPVLMSYRTYRNHKCPVQVLIPYRNYRSVRYRYESLYRCRRYRYSCRTELTEVSDIGIDVIPNLPKCPVPVLMLYETYRRARYRYYRRNIRGVCLVANRTEHLVQFNLRAIFNGIHLILNNSQHFSIWPHKPMEHFDEEVYWVRGSSCSLRDVGIARIAWGGVIT